MLQTIGRVASSLIFPKTCETCDALLPATDLLGVCGACAGKILKISAPFCPGCGRPCAYENTRCGQCGHEEFCFDRAYAACYYEGKTSELLQAFKFGGRKSLRCFFARLLTGFIRVHLDPQAFDAVVSVPLDPAKQRERGYNQALLLSAPVARELAKPELSSFFKKKKTFKTQSSLNKTERARNIEGTFFVTDAEPFSEKRILLVDDILTTGFTASECAGTLKQAGARAVTVLAAARGL